MRLIKNCLTSCTESFMSLMLRVDTFHKKSYTASHCFVSFIYSMSRHDIHWFNLDDEQF